METQALVRVLKRIARAGVAGGIASLATFLASGIPLKDFADLQLAAFPIAMAFLTGAIMGIDKLTREW